MKVNITTMFGMSGTAGKIQNMVADIAKRCLHYNELGVYCCRWVDPPQLLRTRLDGVIASVSHGDIVIFQFPIWNGIEFEEALSRQLSNYRGLKKIFFIHDVEPLMFGVDDKGYDRYISLYNQADLIILPSQRMADFLRAKGLTVAKIIIQRMWDDPVPIDATITPKFKKVMNFAGDINTQKFAFAKKWMYDTVKLAVTETKGDWADGKNIDCLGWFNDEFLLVDALRRNGGFGLLWTEDLIWNEYMKYNSCAKLSTYLAAGLPVIVPGSIPEAETIRNKNLGYVVGSLDEAVQTIEGMSEEQYDQMVMQVASFGKLIRGGYFTKKILIDAVFKLLYD